jgi:hypothetical protein
MTRDEARAAILNAKGATRPLTIFGVDLEMREPPIQDVIDAQQHTDQKQAFANLVIKFSYLPGESEPLFTDEDAEQLLNMPFGKDARQLMAVIQDFMGVTPDAASKSEASE